MRERFKHLRVFFAGVVFLAGCQSTEHYRKERIAKADRAFTEIRSDILPKDQVLTLPFCIHTALTKNLNLRVYELKEAVNLEQRTAAALGMLPDVIATNDISVRSNQPGASSYSLLSGRESLEPSQSSENWENRVRVEFLFSFIDFGLAYFNAVQGKDRALITTEQKRRASQNLILDVARAYFKVAAAQYAMENTERMLNISDETEKLLESMVRNKRLPMEKIITEKKTFLILKKSLMEYRRSYENSCIELKSLMGYYPRHELVVDTSCMKNLADLKFPEIELMEEIALIERPELYQLDIQKHITAIAARKVVIEMFPNVGIFMDFTNSTNKYLYYNSWWELGARAAYRLLRVPQKMIEYSAIEKEVDQIEMQVRALSVGIISQVRIAYANLKEVEQRYLLCEKLFEAYVKHEQIKEKHAQTSGALSRIELNRIKMETAQKDIERTQALGNYYLAYFRLLNSVGLNSLDPESLDKIKNRVKESFEETEYEESENIAEYKLELEDIDKELSECNDKIVSLNGSVTEFQGNVTASESKLKELADELKEKEKQLLNESESRISSLNYQLSVNKGKIEDSRRSLEDQKYDYNRKLAEAESKYSASMDSYNARGVDDDAYLERINDEYDSSRADAEQSYREVTDSIHHKIASYEDEIDNINDQLEDEKDNLEDKLSELRDNYGDQLDDYSDNKADHSESLAYNKAELKEYVDKASELERERADIQKQLDDAQMVIDEHTEKLGRYMAAIELLKEDISNSDNILIGQDKKSKVDKAIIKKLPASDLELTKKIDEVSDMVSSPKGPGEIGSSKPVELDPVSNLTMQQQNQTPGNSIPFEEFQPEATKNIDMQTQANAGTANIPIQAYNPETQNDITIQTLRQSGNNEINFQEYGSKFNTGEDKIGNDDLNKQLDKQLSKPLE